MSSGNETDEAIDNLMNGINSDASSELADDIHEISPGDIVQYYDETKVRGRPDAMKTTLVEHLTDEKNHFVYLESMYPLQRDTPIRIVSKLQKDGTYVTFKESQLMPAKKYHYKETGYYKKQERPKSLRQFQKELDDIIAESWEEKMAEKKKRAS